MVEVMLWIITHAISTPPCLGSPVPVTLAQGIHGLIQARALAIPHGKDAIVVAIVVVVGLLGAPDGGHGQVFVGARPEVDVVLLQQSSTRQSSSSIAVMGEPR